MFYLVAFLSCSCVVAMLALVYNQNRILYGPEDLFGLVPLVLPVDANSMRELFDPAQEWGLCRKIDRKMFKVVQRNRRRLALQHTSHMYRNAGLLQRVGRAAMRTRKMDHLLLGKALVSAGFAVKMISSLLMVFLRFEQLVYTASRLSALRDIVNDLLPQYEQMRIAAFDLSQVMDPKLHEELMRVL